MQNSSINKPPDLKKIRSTNLSFVEFIQKVEGKVNRRRSNRSQRNGDTSNSQEHNESIEINEAVIEATEDSEYEDIDSESETEGKTTENH